MTLTVEFDESGGYDCMTAAFRLSDGEKTVATIDLLDLGQKSCGDYAGCVEEARKFANLFSAAPDLLAALENFVEWHANNFDDFSSDVNSQLLCLANDASAAISKARGEV